MWPLKAQKHPGEGQVHHQTSAHVVWRVVKPHGSFERLCKGLLEDSSPLGTHLLQR